MIKRLKLSGAAYRKLKANKEKKLTKYLSGWQFS